jgi:hypothetical protein
MRGPLLDETDSDQRCQSSGDASVITTFDVHNFRTFSNLRVERFGKVNLVVGRNNVGKTMLLEALRLYSVGGDPFIATNLLVDRDEVAADGPIADNEENVYPRIDALFHRPPENRKRANEFSLGPIGDASRTVNVREVQLRVQGWGSGGG